MGLWMEVWVVLRMGVGEMGIVGLDWIGLGFEGGWDDLRRIMIFSMGLLLVSLNFGPKRFAR
jgi:hypothetical protein